MKSAYCPSCHRQSTVTETEGTFSCVHCGSSLLLRDRWWLPEMLGHGASGYTWKGVDRADGSEVAIKELSFRRLTDFKQLELFEREAQALSSLSHESIPTFIDHFIVEEDRFVSAYLVQELIDGDVLDLSARTDEEEVLRFFDEMADLLEYLQSRRPPVIHRDIKPSNVMRRRDGRYVLIDFGSVRQPAEAAEGGSTVAGTLGYMAPEQLVGRAELGSDYYGLGATALALMAGRNAHDLIEHHRPGGWKERVELGEDMTQLLMGLLEVDVDQRLKTPDELRDAIEKVRSPQIHAPPTEPSSPLSPSPPSSPPSPSSPPRQSSDSGGRSSTPVQWLVSTLSRLTKMGLSGFSHLTAMGRGFAMPLIATAILLGLTFLFYERISPGFFQEIFFRIDYHGVIYLIQALLVVGGHLLWVSLAGIIVIVPLIGFIVGVAPRWLIPILTVGYLFPSLWLLHGEIVPETEVVMVMQKESQTRFLSQNTCPTQGCPLHDCELTLTDEDSRVVGLVEHRADGCTVEVVDDRFLRLEAEDRFIYKDLWSAEVIFDLDEELADQGAYRIVSSSGPRVVVELQDGSNLNTKAVLPETPTDLVHFPALAGQDPPKTDLHRPEVILPSTCGKSSDRGPVVSHYSTAFGDGDRKVSGLDGQGRATWTHANPPSEFFELTTSFDVEGECWFYVNRFIGGEMLRLDRDTGDFSRVVRF